MKFSTILRKPAAEKDFPVFKLRKTPVLNQPNVQLEAKNSQDIPSILIVGDRSEDSELEAILAGPHRTLLWADSADEALQQLLQQDVALVLIHIRVPEMNGFEIARLIRAQKEFVSTPIIFLTTENGTEEMESQGYSVGGVDYIEKPFMPEILRAKVDVFLNFAVARRQLEQEVERRHHAEKKLERVANRLRARAKDLEIANQELEAFAYSASHDLRAPLRHITGFVNLLQEEPEEDSEPFLDRILQSADKMNQLLDDLLAFSKVGRMEMRMAPVDLEELFEEVLEGLEPETRNRSIVWQRSRLPEVIGDCGMLRQVLVNLLSNALKYTIHVDPAKIEVGWNANGKKATIFIRDNGAGFNMEFADKLFKVFQRLHLGSEFDGTGIGLANVQRIIQRHGGRIWGEGSVGKGATFRFSLPLAEPNQKSNSNRS